MLLKRFLVEVILITVLTNKFMIFQSHYERKETVTEVNVNIIE